MSSRLDPYCVRRIVVCDYNALLLSITGVLRMSGYCVFQAHDGQAAHELCLQLPDIALLIVNTSPTDESTLATIHAVRSAKPDLPILHIGVSSGDGTPSDVPTLAPPFDPDQLLAAVENFWALERFASTAAHTPDFGPLTSPRT